MTNNWLKSYLNAAETESTRKEALMAQSTEVYPRWQTCGMIMSRFNPVDGKMRQIVTSCGDFRNCSSCREKRVKHYQDEVERVAGVGAKFYAMVVPNHASSSFDYYRRKIDADYIKIPINGEEFIAIVDSPDILNSRKLSFDEYPVESIKMMMSNHICIPEGTRVTGKLLKSINAKEDDKKEDPDEYVEVSVSQFISNADTNKLNEVSRIASRKLMEQIEYVDQSNVQLACDIIVGEVKTQLLQQGFYVMSQGFKREKVDVNSIKWDCYAQKVRINRIESLNNNNSSIKPKKLFQMARIKANLNK